MWTQRHPARHVACLKRMVTSHAVPEVAGWLEWAAPPRSESATPTLSVVQAIARHLRVGGGWRVFAAGHAALAHDRMMRDLTRLRRRAVGRSRSQLIADG